MSGEGLGEPALLLPPERRRDFAWPRGLLCSGNGCLSRVPPVERVACVGDVVSTHCVEALGEGSLNPSLLIIVFDGKTRRGPLEDVKPVGLERFRLYETSNPPGGITLRALRLICELARASRGLYAVRVDGEEDMLALAVIECMPEGSLVTYGVPGRGMTLILVTRERRLDAWMRHTYLEPGLPRLAYKPEGGSAGGHGGL